MLHDNENSDMPDRMGRWVTVGGYGGAAVIVFLMFWLAAPVTG